MPCSHLRVWQENLPDALFVNHYGPTEITASCTWYIVDHLVSEDETLPIGQPFRNTNILLITEDGREAAPGETGEIYVQGTSLALGYYRNPEKTREVFVRNPLNPIYDETVYRTGDLGKYNERGELLFCGRKDAQIKHMGHRVELGRLRLPRCPCRRSGRQSACIRKRSSRYGCFIRAAVSLHGRLPDI